jgi:hypothetical protein
MQLTSHLESAVRRQYRLITRRQAKYLQRPLALFTNQVKILRSSATCFGVMHPSRERGAVPAENPGGSKLQTKVETRRTYRVLVLLLVESSPSKISRDDGWAKARCSRAVVNRCSVASCPAVPTKPWVRRS